MFTSALLSVALATIVTPWPADRANVALSTAIVQRAGDSRLKPHWRDHDLDPKMDLSLQFPQHNDG